MNGTPTLSQKPASFRIRRWRLLALQQKVTSISCPSVTVLFSSFTDALCPMNIQYIYL